MDIIRQEELTPKHKEKLKKIQKTLTARRNELAKDIAKLDKGLAKLDKKLKPQKK